MTFFSMTNLLKTMIRRDYEYKKAALTLNCTHKRYQFKCKINTHQKNIELFFIQEFTKNKL